MIRIPLPKLDLDNGAFTQQKSNICSIPRWLQVSESPARPGILTHVDPAEKRTPSSQ